MDDQKKIDQGLDYIKQKQFAEKRHKLKQIELKQQLGEDMQLQMARIKEEEYMRRIAFRNLEEYEIDIGMSGTTCTLLIIIGDMIYFGFVGDSLLAISKFMNTASDKHAQNNDHIITKPWHVPEESHEKNRIYRCKGEVRGERPKKQKKAAIIEMGEDILTPLEPDFETGMFDATDRPRIYFRARNYPGIQTTRSLGDFHAHKIGVTSEPRVGTYKVGRHNQYLVVANCALWNVMTPL